MDREISAEAVGELRGEGFGPGEGSVEQVDSRAVLREDCGGGPGDPAGTDNADAGRGKIDAIGEEFENGAGVGVGGADSAGRGDGDGVCGAAEISRFGARFPAEACGGFFVWDGDAGSGEVEVFVVEEGVEGCLETRGGGGRVFFVGGDREGEVDGVVVDGVEAGVVDQGAEGLGDGPADDAEEVGIGVD